MKTAVAVLAILLASVAKSAVGQETVARFDSLSDEMTGRKAYYVVVTSPDTLQWTYGPVTSWLSLVCTTTDKNPKWSVTATAAPQFDLIGEEQYSSFQMKTDVDYDAEVEAKDVESGTTHMLEVSDNKGFTKRMMKTKRLMLRWVLLTNETVTFRYDMSAFVSKIPQLYAACGKTVPS